MEIEYSSDPGIQHVTIEGSLKMIKEKLYGLKDEIASSGHKIHVRFMDNGETTRLRFTLPETMEEGLRRRIMAALGQVQQ